MKTTNMQVVRIAFTVMLLACALLAQVAPKPAPAAWQTTVQHRLPLYGHRNWIVVADAAYPAYSQSGIETIVVNQDLPSVVKYVAHAISSSKHVRATVFVDQELQFVQETDYPGVTALREAITQTFAKSSLSTVPHAESIAKIDDAGKTFRVLFIKTNTTIPYTSVFLRLDCGYLTDEVDKKIKDAMAAASK
ncbi:MAG: RbsD/FucU domain-containing protein [Terriglobales bacterium]